MGIAIVLVLAITAIIATVIKLINKETTYIVYMTKLARVALALELAANKPY